MKIYYYDADTGIYQGEDFADERMFLARGVFMIPPHATTIEPPGYKRGQAPYYDVKSNRWEVRELPCRENAEQPIFDAN